VICEASHIPVLAGKAKAGMVYSVMDGCGWMDVGCPGKTEIP